MIGTCTENSELKMLRQSYAVFTLSSWVNILTVEDFYC